MKNDPMCVVVSSYAKALLGILLTRRKREDELAFATKLGTPAARLIHVLLLLRTHIHTSYYYYHSN